MSNAQFNFSIDNNATPLHSFKHKTLDIIIWVDYTNICTYIGANIKKVWKKNGKNTGNCF